MSDERMFVVNLFQLTKSRSVSPPRPNALLAYQNSQRNVANPGRTEREIQSVITWHSRGALMHIIICSL